MIAWVRNRYLLMQPILEPDSVLYQNIPPIYPLRQCPVVVLRLCIRQEMQLINQHRSYTPCIIFIIFLKCGGTLPMVINQCRIDILHNITFFNQPDSQTPAIGIGIFQTIHRRQLSGGKSRT